MDGDGKLYVVGVDVGTGSARAALVTVDGCLVKLATHPIYTWNPKSGYYHQSSDNIWASCVKVIRDVVRDIDRERVKGIGFDATCSLVVLDDSGNPLTISPDGEDSQNVILWMDHRAESEAETVNNTKHPVLQSVGGKISLEMQIPKLMWLKKNLPNTWKKVGMFFDLPDYLTWKSTGSDSRSLCSVVCKWTYEFSGEGCEGWNKEFFSQVGLSELLNGNCSKIGSVVLAPGSPCGRGLTTEAAHQLGLRVGTPVATSIIDAHAGGLGLLACQVPGVSSDFCTRLGLICGTSTCHMAVSRAPVFVLGVWGPYLSAMVPDLWLNEGGQSATGNLIDHVIQTHPASHTLHNATDQNVHLVSHLNKLLVRMADHAGVECVDQLTRDLHVWPDHHGNRSPLADPTLRGMVSGLTLSANEEDLALLYLATVQALSYGTRQILESLEAAGHARMECVLVCGGLSKNELYVRTQATVAGRPVVVPRQQEAVLAGAALLGATAAGLYTSVEQAVGAMGGPADVIMPDQRCVRYHNKKYEVFLRMLSDQLAYRDMMHSS